jgi:hypothetical protein
LVIRFNTLFPGANHCPSEGWGSRRSPLPAFSPCQTFQQSIFPVHQADLPHPFTPTRYARTPNGVRAATQETRQ